MSYYQRYYFETMNCQGPCGRVGISLDQYDVETKRIFKQSGLCSLCGNGSEYLYGLVKDRDYFQKLVPINQKIQRQESVRLALQRMGCHRKHPAIYKAISAGQIGKSKPKQLYSLQNRPIEKYMEHDEDEIENEAEEESSHEEEQPVIIPSEKDLESDMNPANEKFEEYSSEDDEEQSQDQVSEEDEQELDILRKRKGSNSPTRPVKLQKKEEVKGTCCFCGEECNPSSQSCGICIRNVYSVMSKNIERFGSPHYAVEVGK